MGYSVFLKEMLTSAKLSLFHYVYGPLIQYSAAENGKNLIASGIRKIKREIEKKKGRQLM